jgi:hypothetical protein
MFLFERGLLNLKVEFVVKILIIKLFLFNCKKEALKSYLVKLLKLAIVIIKMCLVRDGEIKILFEKKRVKRLDLLFKILTIVPVAVPVTVPFRNVNVIRKTLIINVVIKNVKLQLYRQMFFMVHLKKVLFQIEKFIFLGSVLKVQVGRFSENVNCLIMVVEKLNFKRDLKDI